MSKKKEIVLNPLAEYLGSRTTTVPAKKIAAAKDDLEVKQRITIHLSKGVIDRAKNAVYWEPGLTMTELAEEALKKELDRLEKKRGEQYPQRKGATLKGGRPVS